MYWDTIYGRAAMGIHKGSGPNGKAVFSHLPYVMKDYRLRLSAP